MEVTYYRGSHLAKASGNKRSDSQRMEEQKDWSFMTLLSTLDSQPSDFILCEIMNCLYCLSHFYSCCQVFVAKNIPVTLSEFLFTQSLTYYSVNCIIHLLEPGDLFKSTRRSA